MAARAPRRSFASPFVLTLAASLPAAACYVQSQPGPRGGTPARDHTAGPTPVRDHTSQPGDGARPPDHATTTAGAQPAPSPPVTTISNPPAPQPAPAPPVQTSTTDRRWTVSKSNGTCRVYEDATCPPNATCNPPPPQKYACLDDMNDGASVKIVQRAGEKVCTTIPMMPKCPPNVMCNPPPPRKVTCPR